MSLTVHFFNGVFNISKLTLVKRSNKLQKKNFVRSKSFAAMVTVEVEGGGEEGEALQNPTHDPTAGLLC